MAIMCKVVGDDDLARMIGSALGNRPGAWAAASVSHEVRLCASGVSLDADFEIGSLSKGFTGLLYAEAVARGEVTAQTRLAEVLPLNESPIADITLGSLSTHTSGLPRLAPGSAAIRGTWQLWRHGTNPYRDDLPTLLSRALAARPKTRPARPAYSNFGFQLLGHGLAAAARTSYAELLRIRIAQPLGLTKTYVPTSPREIQPGAVEGTSRNGHPTEPWANVAIGPAGGIRSSISDLAIFTAALLDGSAPGMSALDPVCNFAGKAAKIGAAWMILSTPAGEVTWHNGGTGGFRSWLGLNRDGARGFVVVSANTRSVDRCGFDFLSGNLPHPSGSSI